eukprot:2106588-Rhodomonas_salina.1
MTCPTNAHPMRCPILTYLMLLPCPATHCLCAVQYGVLNGAAATRHLPSALAPPHELHVDVTCPRNNPLDPQQRHQLCGNCGLLRLISQRPYWDPPSCALAVGCPTLTLLLPGCIQLCPLSRTFSAAQTF